MLQKNLEREGLSYTVASNHHLWLAFHRSEVFSEGSLAKNMRTEVCILDTHKGILGLYLRPQDFLVLWEDGMPKTTEWKNRILALGWLSQKLDPKTKT
jgi:hypothetical protein